MSEQYGTLWDMMDKRLEYIEQSINIIKTDVAVIKDRQVTLIEDISNVKCTIYGNGKVGLVTQVALNRRESAILATGMGLIASILGTLGISALKGK